MTGHPRSTPLDVTDRQLEVARLVAAGHTNEGIARELEITHDGAEYHVSELLGRLGFERREEIAAWYRREHGSVVARTRRRLRSLTLTPVGLVASGAFVAVAAVALLIVAFEGALGGGGSSGGSVTFGPSGPITLPEPPAEPPPPAEYIHERSGQGWETRAAADLGRRDLLALLYSTGLQAEVHLIDRATGETVGELSAGRSLEVDSSGEVVAALVAGRNPLIAYARETGMLILSDTVSRAAPGEEESTQWSRVLVFDVADGLSLESVLELPGTRRGGHSGTGPLVELGYLTLSADERYLYYLTAQDERDAVRVIDLNDTSSETAITALVEGCSRTGPPSLYPMGNSSVIAKCLEPGIVQVIGPDGPTGSEIDTTGLVGNYALPDSVGPDRGDQSVLLSAAVEVPDGVGLIFHDGTYAVASSADAAVVGRVLPPEREYVNFAWRGEVLRLGKDHLAVPYHNEWPFAGEHPPPWPDGLAIFDAASATVERDVEVKHAGSYPLNDREIALVGDGRLDILNLTTMTVTETFNVTHPEAPERLPVVR